MLRYGRLFRLRKGTLRHFRCGGRARPLARSAKGRSRDDDRGRRLQLQRTNRTANQPARAAPGGSAGNGIERSYLAGLNPAAVSRSHLAAAIVSATEAI